MDKVDLSLFWKGRRVLITGHTGFKGSWLSSWLLKLGADVSGFSKSVPTQPSLFESLNLIKEMPSFEKDIQDFSSVDQAIRTSRPQIIFHFAAQSVVSKSYQNPIESFSTNVLGTVNILESVRRQPSVQAVVVATSDKCYEVRPTDITSYTESSALGAADPYSTSKACAEFVCTSFQKSFGLKNIGSARSGNVIGGGDWTQDRLVPDLIRGWSDKTPVLVRQPHFTRPWQHVLDPLRGYLLLAESLVNNPADAAGAWNFGPKPGSVRSVRDVCLKIEKSLQGLQMEFANPLVDSNIPTIAETKDLQIDSSKANERLLWQPTWDFEIAVQKTASWYHDWAAGQKALELVTRDIDSYERSI